MSVYLTPRPKAEVSIEKPIIIHGDVMVTSDYHIPLHDELYINKMIKDARTENLTQLAIGGDFFNMDALSTYFPKQENAGLGYEIQQAQEVLHTLCSSFDAIYIFWGNHDGRFTKTLGYKISFAEAVSLLLGGLSSRKANTVTVSNLDHGYIKSGSEEFLLAHPEAYARTPLYTPKNLSQKYDTNVICGHAHHCALGHSPSGRLLVECGGLFDVSKTAYLQRTTTHPCWSQGYLWIKDGVITIRSPKWQT